MKLPYEFYHRPCLEVARDLVGKVLVYGDKQLRISETEAYVGESDTACHAHKGRTRRTEVMYMEAGTIYIYLCYGVHWLLNIVTGEENEPEAVLIRACVEAEGPGKLTKRLGITGQLNRKHICGEDLYIIDDGFRWLDGKVLPADTTRGEPCSSFLGQHRSYRRDRPIQ